MWSVPSPSVAALALVTAAASTTVPSALGDEPRTPHGQGLAMPRAAVASAPPSVSAADGADSPVLATLAQTHTAERVVLSDFEPTQARFDSLLADRATGQRATLDPRLLELLRSLARAHPGGRIELVSGYRSPKLNEMLRKKGHHVASHSQHSLGHAVDFRIVPPDASALPPRQVEREIRALGWTGGIGTYVKKDDWFVHADVGPNRRWDGQ